MNTITKISRGDFINFIDKNKPIWKGNGKRIAMAVGITYKKFGQYCKGSAPDSKIREKIIKEIKNIKNIS